MKKELEVAVANYRREFFLYKEVISMCNRMKGAQDKVLIYGMYLGLGGYQLEELRNLKYSDIKGLEVVTVNGNKEIDEFFLGLIEEAKNEEKNDSENRKSEFIIKGKPCKLNNDGLDPISYQSVQSRLRNICTLLKERITYTVLHRSKVIEDMLLINKDWKYAEVRRYLEEKAEKFNAYNIYLKLCEYKEYIDIEKNRNIFNEAICNTIKTSKFTKYEKEVIASLYKVVAALSLVNEMQYRKLTSICYKYLKNSGADISVLNSLLNELLECDKFYWEFIINEGFELQDNYEIKVYATYEDYMSSKERYYIEYLSGEYYVVDNIEYDLVSFEDIENSLRFKSTDSIDVANWLITELNKIKCDERCNIIKGLECASELKEELTEPYLNDIGLDMILAIKDTVDFKTLNVNYSICEQLESYSEVKKATPCIDASNCGESYIKVVLSDGRSMIISFVRDGEIRKYKSIGVNARYEVYRSIEGVLSGNRELNNICSINQAERYKKIESLRELIDKKNRQLLSSINTQNEVYDPELIHYEEIDYGYEKELIVSMYEYDLSIMVDSEGNYIVKKRVVLSGTPARIYDIFKGLDGSELVEWLFSVKFATYSNLDFSVF